MLTGVRAQVMDGPDRGLVRESSEPLVVGTSTENQLVLTDPTISRYHVELQSDEGIQVRDLGSRNGTFINGVRVRTAVVPIGAHLRVGGSVIRLLAPSATPPSVVSKAPLELPGVVAWSAAMQMVARNAVRSARSSVSVLLAGRDRRRQGTRRARDPRRGPRARGPFVVVDCGSMPPTLIASQLFGHERGAFTGADRRHAGAFERAHGGTVFLDEIGELPLDVQPTLLGVLERRAFTPRRRQRGRSHVDVRVLAATHRDLRAEVNAGPVPRRPLLTGSRSRRS